MAGGCRPRWTPSPGPNLLHFSPADYESELDGKAFRSEQLGEFIINCIATGEEGQAKGPVLTDLVRLLLSEEEVTRLMIVPDGSDSSLWQELRHALRDVDDEKKHVTLEVSGESAPVMGVRRLLYEIVYNLCDNAIVI